MIEKRKVQVSLPSVDAQVLYHEYEGFTVKTLLVAFAQKRRVLSTWSGLREVRYVANVYQPLQLSLRTMEKYESFEKAYPKTIGIPNEEITFLSTAADMDNMAKAERAYRELAVCCLATAGAKNNALRTGVDVANWFERNGKFESTLGTINVILLTNTPLTDGAMARAIITITEAKTAALQDLNVRSTYTPENQATGTGTDNVIVVSGNQPGQPLRYTGGHTKIGELIGHAAKTAVAEALKKQDGLNT